MKAPSDSAILFTGDGLADARASIAGPVGVLVEPRQGSPARLLAAGPKAEVEAHPAARAARRVDAPAHILIPGLFNAHVHLDLTHIGPREYDPAGGFAAWAKVILGGRLAEGPELVRSVEDGIRRSLAGGVVAVGDIAGVQLLGPVRAVQDSPLLGVSFIEFFGLGDRQRGVAEGMDRLVSEVEGMRSHPRVRVGLQPHAPYTVGSELYEWAVRTHARTGMPLATHLAENTPERRLIQQGEGPFRALLEGMGLWQESILKDLGRGKRPLGHLARFLSEAPFLLAHVNDCDDEELSRLARTRCSIAYCPRSSAYFRNEEDFGGHRYREMMAAGINVALGTDSVVNLPREEADRLSTLDEMRFLWRRDGVEPRILLAMATVNGARALGLEESMFRLIGRESGGGLAGLVAVEAGGVAGDPARAVVESTSNARILITPVSEGKSWES